VHASEDVGMADPTALQTAVAAAQAVEFVGLPEARLNLAQAVIHIALAPKSNAVAKAIMEAGADVQQGLAGPVPKHLRDASYSGAARLGHGKGYIYAHDDPAGVVQQQYAPDGLVGKRYYEPTTHGAEARVSERSERIRAILRGGAEPAAGSPQASGRERAESRAGSDAEPAQDPGRERPESRAGSDTEPAPGRERPESRAASGEEPG
jgi:putative ATPase